MKAFGYKGEPETCLWCGKKLPRLKLVESVIVTTEEGYHSEFKPTGEVRVGYRGDQTFCTLTCGYSFGLAFAQHGQRLTAKKG